MGSAQWCLNPSAQMRPLAYPSAQRQSRASPSWEICNILYNGPLGWGPLLGATEGLLPPQKWLWCPYRSSQWPCPSHCSWCSLLPQWAPSLLLSVRDPGVPHEPSLAMGPSASRPLLPGNLEVVSLAGQSLAPLLAMWALTLCLEPLTLHLPFGSKPSSPQNFYYEVSAWNLERWEGSACQQWLAWGM